jgi:hypothetical protein
VSAAAKQAAGCRYIVANTLGRFAPAGPQSDRTNQLVYLQNAIAQPTTCYDEITFTFDKGDGPDLPPGYLVEYRTAPYGLEGIATSTSSFAPAKYVLYVEIHPAATVDLRAGRNTQTYKGNLRLQLVNMQHTNIVEWVRDVPPSPEPSAASAAVCTNNGTATTTSTTTPTPTTTTKPSRSPSTSSSTTTSVPSTTSTTVFGTPIDIAQQRVVWLIGLDSCRPFSVDSANNPPHINVLIMN